MEAGRAVHGSRRQDHGFTLIEMIFTMVLLGILLAIAVPGWRSYQRASEQSGSERDLVSFLRSAQASAVSEETKYKAVFAADGKSVTLQRYDGTCSCFKQSAQLRPNGASVTYSSPSFKQADGSMQTFAIFAGSGSATPGTVKVLRSGTSKVYTVTVEGLTGRVSG
jgi:prepilin-type N-terminal cleavage/methylation domain-containing protein